MLALKPTSLGDGKLEDDYFVLDDQRRKVGRIRLHPQARATAPWFWSITARYSQYPHDLGYAATREDTMDAFKTARLGTGTDCSRQRAAD